MFRITSGRKYRTTEDIHYRSGVVLPAGTIGTLENIRFGFLIGLNVNGRLCLMYAAQLEPATNV